MKTITKKELEEYALEHFEHYTKNIVEMTLKDAVNMAGYLVEDIGWISPNYFIAKEVPLTDLLIQFDNYGTEPKSNYKIKVIDFDDEVIINGNPKYPEGEVIVSFLYVLWKEHYIIYAPICSGVDKKDIHIGGIGILNKDVAIEERIVIINNMKKDLKKIEKAFVDMIYEWSYIQLAASHPVYSNIFRNYSVASIYDISDKKQNIAKLHKLFNASQIMNSERKQNTDKYKYIEYTRKRIKGGLEITPARWKKV